MGLNKWIRVAFVVVLCVAMMPVMAAAGQPAQPDKLDPVLRQTLADRGGSDFIVEFTQQADLSAAYSMDWAARGEYVVQALQAVAQQVQAPAIAVLDRRGMRHETFIAGNELYVYGGTLEAALDMAALPNVAYVRVPGIYYVDPIIAEAPMPEATTDWGISDSKADQFWSAYGFQGDGIVVANIDTGVQWNHPALVNAFKCPGAPSDPACWKDPANRCGGSACDNNGHGTHTMGTMVADDNPALTYIAGMAPNAKWIACKGCRSSACYNVDLNACADWLLAPGGNTANRPHVVNNSWGGGGGNTWYQAKVQAWVAAGIFPAFSAGNSGPGCSSLGSPGDYQESFASAAHTSSRTVASYSSRGPSAFGHDPYTKPNISAPGSYICSTVPTDGWSCSYSGTSMASPHSAGAVALLWSCNSSLIGQIDQTFQLLQNNADTPPAGNCGAPPDGQGNYTYGYGYLNVLAAGSDACGAPPEPPAAPSNLVATAVSDTQIDLIWSDNSSNESGFKIERSPDNSTWAQIATVGMNVESYSDTGLSPSTTYYYRVRAYNGGGDSAYSNVAWATTNPPSPNTMHVESITTSYRRGFFGRYTVTALIKINDPNNSPVSGATVTAQWTLPNGLKPSQSRTTASDGVATFSYTSRTGTWQICVTNVVKSGWTYNPGGNHITCKTVPVP